MLVNRFNEQMNKKIELTPESIGLLMKYDFPGNVRELENLVERLIAVSRKNKIHTYDLPKYFHKQEGWNPGKLKGIVRKTERENIIKTLETTNWKKIETAKILGITPKTLWEKIKKYNIS